MNCSEFNNKMIDYLYETLDPEAELHLQQCDVCGEEFKKNKYFQTVMSHMEVFEPSFNSVQTILKMASKRGRGVVFHRLSDRIHDFFALCRLSGNWAPGLVVVLFMMASFVLFGGHQLPFGGQAGVDSAGSFFSQNNFNQSQNVNENQPIIAGQRGAVDLKNVSIDDASLLSRLNDSQANQQFTLSDLEQQFEHRQQDLFERDADQLLMRGRRFKTMGRIDLALRDFETIYRFYPNYTYMGDVLMYRAQCYAFQGRTDEAIKSLDELIIKDPSKKSLIDSMLTQLKAVSQ